MLTRKGKTRFIRVTRISTILASIFIVLAVVIPNYFIAIAKAPPENDLHVTGGTVILKKTGKRVGKIGLQTTNGDKYFSCATRYSGSKILCGGKLLNTKGALAIEGKQAEIHWYEQPIFPPFVFRNRMMKIYVEGEEYLSYVKGVFVKSCG